MAGLASSGRQLDGFAIHVLSIVADYRAACGEREREREKERHVHKGASTCGDGAWEGYKAWRSWMERGWQGRAAARLTEAADGIKLEAGQVTRKSARGGPPDPLPKRLPHPPTRRTPRSSPASASGAAAADGITLVLSSRPAHRRRPAATGPTAVPPNTTQAALHLRPSPSRTATARNDGDRARREHRRHGVRRRARTACHRATAALTPSRGTGLPRRVPGTGPTAAPLPPARPWAARVRAAPATLP